MREFKLTEGKKPEREKRVIGRCEYGMIVECAGHPCLVAWAATIDTGERRLISLNRPEAPVSCASDALLPILGRLTPVTLSDFD